VPGQTRALARQLYEAGVDLVIGHHPHVLQGHAAYAASAARPGLGLAAFSLGNFVFDSHVCRKADNSALDLEGSPACQRLPPALRLPAAREVRRSRLLRVHVAKGRGVLAAEYLDLDIAAPDDPDPVFQPRPRPGAAWRPVCAAVDPHCLACEAAAPPRPPA
jgi:hypothetical protein